MMTGAPQKLDEHRARDFIGFVSRRHAKNPPSGRI